MMKGNSPDSQSNSFNPQGSGSTSNRLVRFNPFPYPFIDQGPRRIPVPLRVNTNFPEHNPRIVEPAPLPFVSINNYNASSLFSNARGGIAELSKYVSDLKMEKLFIQYAEVSSVPNEDIPGDKKILVDIARRTPELLTYSNTTDIEYVSGIADDFLYLLDNDLKVRIGYFNLHNGIIDNHQELKRSAQEEIAKIDNEFQRRVMAYSYQNRNVPVSKQWLQQQYRLRLDYETRVSNILGELEIKVMQDITRKQGEGRLNGEMYNKNIGYPFAMIRNDNVIRIGRVRAALRELCRTENRDR